MNCKQAQRLILRDTANSDVQQHVRECSDCRVAQQRALRLQQLLTVKRHETPGTHYFDNFLHDFHHRLAAETAPRPTIFQRLCALVCIEPAPRLRYGFAHALGVAFAVALMWRGLVTSDLPVNTAQFSDRDLVTPTLTTASLPAPMSTPRKIAAALPAPSPVAVSPLALPAPALRDFTGPRYVLDRITVSPAGYEMANVNF